MQFIRYPTAVSDSGAYIFAPRTTAVNIDLEIIDAKVVNHDRQDPNDQYIQQKLLIFYKSQYLNQCFSLMTISIN